MTTKTDTRMNARHMYARHIHTPRIASFVVLCAGLFALCASSLSAESPGGGPELAGSIRIEGGYLGLRDDIPEDAIADWYGAFSTSARIREKAGPANFYAALWCGYDAVTGDWTPSLDEAWAELTPTEFIAGKIGRFGVRFGPCLAFNPANALAAKDPFDDRANKVGLDGMAVDFYPLSLPASGEHTASLAVRAALLLPGDTSADSRPAGSHEIPDAGKSTAHGELVLFLPELAQTEIGVAGNIRHLDGTDTTGVDAVMQPGAVSARDAGAWLSADIAGFVIGLEGTLRSEEWGGAASVNRRAGDWLAIAEASYMSDRDSWQGFIRLGWSAEDSDIALSALCDFGSNSSQSLIEAARTAIEASRNVTDFLVLEAKASWNYRSERLTTQVPVDYSAGVAVEYFY
jgi:hypothetical protein